MSSKRQISQQDVRAHTVLIGDVRAMWEKLWWDVDVFCDVQRAYPDERQPLVYAALNACISAWSLEQWSKAAYKHALRKTGADAPVDFDSLLSQMVPAQAACADIANTTKHGSHRESRWHGGQLTLDWDEGSEYYPSGFHLLKNESGESIAFFSSLDALPRGWWGFLERVSLVEGPMPTPDWFRNKMSRIFRGANFVGTA